jgi:hypothetical protein
MQDLSNLRKDWAARNAEEHNLTTTPLTIQESVHQFVILYQTFAAQLQETEAIFGPERRKHLIELQQRLQRIAEWQQEQHGKSISERPSAPKTTE